MNTLRTLQNGHKQCTTCVETTNHDQCMIITGAEKGELCLWSVKDGNLVKTLKLKKRDDVSGIACSKLKPEIFYVSAYRQVLAYDMRQLNKPLEKIAYSGDCINQIALDELETQLAFALDSGEVEVFDIKKKNFSHVLDEHTNICNSVAFQNKSRRLYSGGMDNLLIGWNVEENKVDKKIDLMELSAYSEEMGLLPFFVVSPPFVHSISISRSGRHLACGAENAMVYLFDATGDDLKCIQSYRKHNKGVSQVHFPKFSDDIILSAGNDFRFCAWKIPECPTADVLEVKMEDKHEISSPCLEMTRSEKTNWIATGSDGSKGFVVMVDSTTTPTLYSFPS